MRDQDPGQQRTAGREQTAKAPDGVDGARLCAQLAPELVAEARRRALPGQRIGRVRDTPPGGTVLEAVRADGVISKFDKIHGYFGAYNADRTIRTFFIPNDGLRYFRRQAKK